MLWLSKFKSVSSALSFVFLCMPSMASAQSFSCADSNLQNKFKEELDLSKVPEMCDISTGAKYGKIKIKTENGSQELPCCGVLRIQAQEGAKKQIYLKQQLCADTRVAAAEQACGGAADCIQNNIHLMSASKKVNALLAQNAGKMKTLGEQCLARIDEVAQQVQLDISSVARAKASAPTNADRSAIDGLRQLVRK